LRALLYRIKRILDCRYGLPANLRGQQERQDVMHHYAPPALRDRFLRSVDSRDWLASAELAKNLVGCTNPLPSLTCSELQLPPGSTYGAAAEHVLLVAAAVPSCA